GGDPQGATAVQAQAQPAARAAREHFTVRQGGAMHVVITGCGRTGRALAIRLDAEGDEVTVIELDEAAGRGLPGRCRGQFVPGYGIHPGVLEEAGMERVEAFVALSPYVSANIVS